MGLNYALKIAEYGSSFTNIKNSFDFTDDVKEQQIKAIKEDLSAKLMDNKGKLALVQDKSEYTKINKNITAISNDLDKLQNLEKYMPTREEFDDMIHEIFELYSDIFSDADLDLDDVKITFFLMGGTVSNIGDAGLNKEINVSCEAVLKHACRIVYDKNYSLDDNVEGFIENSVPANKRDEMDADYLAEQKRLLATEIVKNAFRRVIAHELFHIFHDYHFHKFNKRFLSDNTINDILREVFAEYFARYYTEMTIDTEIKDTIWTPNVIKNRVFRYKKDQFGIGRKKLVKDRYAGSEELLAKDEEEYNKKISDGEADFKRDTDGLSASDYAGAYKLYLYNFNPDRNIELFKELYDLMLVGESEDAFYRLLELN